MNGIKGVLCMDFSELVIQRVISSHRFFNETGAGSYRQNRGRSGVVLRFEGETEYTFNGQTLRSNLTHPVLLPKGSSYHWRCLERGGCLNVEFDTDFTSPHPIGFTVSEPEKLRALLQKLELLCLQRPPHWQMSARALTYEVLYLLLASDTRESAYLPSKKAELVRPAIDYIHLYYHTAISNETLAALTSLSVVYFRKLFKAATGLSPIQYLQRLRVEKAKEMLQSDYGTLADVAASVGYSGVFHFSKMFKSITGCSPGTYAAQINHKK